MKALLITLALFTVQASAKEILVVGDSLTCGPFGAKLVSDLNKNPQNHVTVYCTVGSGPYTWISGRRPVSYVDKKTKNKVRFACSTCSGAKDCHNWIRANGISGQLGHSCNSADGVHGPKLADLLKKRKYDNVVVALGTNALGQPLGDSYKSVRTLIEENSKSCSWIGPPHFDGQKSGDASSKESRLNGFYISLNRMLKHADPKDSRRERACNLVDSREATVHPQGWDTVSDGVHRDVKSAENWANAVVGELPTSRLVHEAKVQNGTSSSD